MKRISSRTYKLGGGVLVVLLLLIAFARSKSDKVFPPPRLPRRR